jgi:hypothetical protein
VGDSENTGKPNKSKHIVQREQLNPGHGLVSSAVHEAGKI